MNSVQIDSKKGVFSAIEHKRQEISSLGVKRLGLFGSFLHGSQNAESDVDLIVEFNEGQKTFDNLVNLSFFLEDMLGRHIELVTPESLSPYIRPHIIREVEYVTFTC